MGVCRSREQARHLSDLVGGEGRGGRAGGGGVGRRALSNGRDDVGELTWQCGFERRLVGEVDRLQAATRSGGSRARRDGRRPRLPLLSSSPYLGLALTGVRPLFEQDDLGLLGGGGGVRERDEKESGER